MAKLTYVGGSLPTFLNRIARVPYYERELELDLFLLEEPINDQIASIFSRIPPHITTLNFGWERWIDENNRLQRENPFALGPVLGMSPSDDPLDTLSKKNNNELRELVENHLPNHVQFIVINHRLIPRADFVAMLATQKKLPDMDEAITACYQFQILANAFELFNQATLCLEWGMRLRASETARTLVFGLKQARTEEERNQLKRAFKRNNEHFLAYEETSFWSYVSRFALFIACMLEIATIIVAAIGMPYGLGLWTFLQLNAGTAFAFILQGVAGIFLCPGEKERRWFSMFREPLDAISDAVDQLSLPEHQEFFNHAPVGM